VLTVSDLIVALDAFTPSDAAGATMCDMYQLLERFEGLSDRLPALESMFRLFERFPDRAFGNPGPLVHAIEAIEGYEPFLRESLHRQPTDSAVVLVSRILSSIGETGLREVWLAELRLVLHHPKADKATRRLTRELLRYQFNGTAYS
jgi:hypothetical protein